MIRVAVVEDNQDLLDDVCFNLERSGFKVLACENGELLDAAWEVFLPQVVVLDVGLPGADGFSIASRLRKLHPALGIVMLSARTGLDDRVNGMQLGADNYLCKPVEMTELVAVVLARARAVQLAGNASGQWLFKPRQLLLLSPQGTPLGLTATENLLLSTIVSEPGQQASRECLIRALGGDPVTFDIRRLEVAISRLRHKIRATNADANPLRGLRNQGYIFLEPVLLS